MPLLLLILLVAVLGYMWFSRRNSTLTRVCRWRQDRQQGDWRCAACGARCQTDGGTPRHCLRP